MNKRKILFLASEGGEGQYTRLLDPQLREILEDSAMILCESFFSSIDPEHLYLFDTVVILRTPVAGHAQDDSLVFNSLLSSFENFVLNGGRLLIMFSECYGKSTESCNRLGNIFGISFYFNEIKDVSKNISDMPNTPGCKLLNCAVKSDTLFESIDSEILLLPVSGGHGTQQLSCVFAPKAEFEVLIQGHEHCSSTAYPENLYSHGSKNILKQPVFACRKKFGYGEVLAFPGNSTFWFSDLFLKRWEQILVKQYNNAGLKFITYLLDHSNPQCHYDAKTIKKLSAKKLHNFDDASFRLVKAEKRKELSHMQSFCCWIGKVEENYELEYLKKARQANYDMAVLLYDYDQLDKHKFSQISKMFKKYSFGLELKAHVGFYLRDNEGCEFAVFNIESLPDMRKDYPNSNVLEDILVKFNAYTSIFANTAESRIPPWRHGGYNFIEISKNPEDIKIYHNRIASGAFLAPLHIVRDKMPDKSDKLRNYILADNIENALASIRENRHFSYVGSGIKLKSFMFMGENLIDDDWEGLWYEWDKGESAVLDLEIESERPLKRVIIYDGEKELLTFDTSKKNFTMRLPFEFKHDMRLHLQAFDDQNGEILASYPLYTRNRLYWAHMGSDQMNDYHSCWREDPLGSFAIGNRLYDSFGFVTCGFGWGDYIRIAPPLSWRDIMPQGMEISAMSSHFQSFHPSCFCLLENSFDFLNNHCRKLGFCNEKSHEVFSSSDGSWLQNDSEIWHTKDGRTLQPTRNISKSSLWRSNARYIIPAWQPNGICRVNIVMQVEFLRAMSFSDILGFSIGHSLHIFDHKLKLYVDNKPYKLENFLKDRSSRKFPANKEWDNQAMTSLLRENAKLVDLIYLENKRELKIVDGNGCVFLFRNENIAGRLGIRGWLLPDKRFALDFYLLPPVNDFNASESIDLEYAIELTGENR